MVTAVSIINHISALGVKPLIDIPLNVISPKENSNKLEIDIEDPRELLRPWIINGATRLLVRSKIIHIITPKINVKPM
jgi:hypothetical protein